MRDQRERDLLGWLLGRDVAAAFLVLVGLVALAANVGVQALQIPGYVVLVGFDVLQNPLFPDAAGAAFTAAFAAYLWMVAVGVAAVYRWIRSRRTEPPSERS